MLKRQILWYCFRCNCCNACDCRHVYACQSNPPSSSLELAQLPAPCDCDIRYRGLRPGTPVSLVGF